MFTLAPVNYKGNMDTDLSPASVSANGEQVSLVIANPWGRLTHYEHRDAQGSVAGTHHRKTSFCLEVSHALMSHRFPHFSPSAEAGVSVPHPGTPTECPSRLRTMLLGFLYPETRWSLTRVESVSLYPPTPNLHTLRRKPQLTSLYFLPKHEIVRATLSRMRAKDIPTFKSRYLNPLTLGLCVVPSFCY